MIEEVIREPDAGDRRELVDVLADAFRDNPMNVAIHGPAPARRVRANRAGLRSLVLDGQESTVARVICLEGRVVGGFLAFAPGGRPVPRPTLHRQIGCFIHQGARAMDRWGQVNRGLSAFRPGAEHWYLAALGVSPQFWGRGLGSQLLSDLFSLAETRPAPIYLESDREASVQFYLRRGFLERERIRVHEVPCWCLGAGFG